MRPRLRSPLFSIAWALAFAAAVLVGLSPVVHSLHLLAGQHEASSCGSHCASATCGEPAATASGTALYAAHHTHTFHDPATCALCQGLASLLAGKWLIPAGLLSVKLHYFRGFFAANIHAVASLRLTDCAPRAPPVGSSPAR